MIDILFKTDPQTIGAIAVGIGTAQWQRERHTFFADYDSAREEAQNRLEEFYGGDVPPEIFRHEWELRRASDLENKYFDIPQ